jgi:hypothetical protein
MPHPANLEGMRAEAGSGHGKSRSRKGGAISGERMPADPGQTIRNYGARTIIYRVHRGGRGLYVNTLTALAITSPITVSEMSDCNTIVNFAQAVMGMTSVGLNAVLVVTPRIR